MESNKEYCIRRATDLEVELNLKEKSFKIKDAHSDEGEKTIYHFRDYIMLREMLDLLTNVGYVSTDF